MRLARHLPEHGIAPVVITTDRDVVADLVGTPARRDAGERAATRLGDLPRSVSEAAGRPPRGLLRRLQHFFSTARHIGQSWAPELEAMWDAAVAAHAPSAVYVTAPPLSVLPHALRLAQRSGLPLIVDFRDAWSQWCHNANPTWWHYRAKLRAERAVVEGAAAIVGVSRQLLDDLRRVHPHVDAAKFHLVPSGFDASLAPPSRPDQPRDSGRPFVIGYAGSFYYLAGDARLGHGPHGGGSGRSTGSRYSPRQEDWRYRSPYFFFRRWPTCSRGGLNCGRESACGWQGIARPGSINRRRNLVCRMSSNNSGDSRMPRVSSSSRAVTRCCRHR